MQAPVQSLVVLSSPKKIRKFGIRFFCCYSNSIEKFNYSPIDAQVIESKPRQFDILYTLDDAGEYDIDIKFGGRSVPEGAFSLNLE